MASGQISNSADDYIPEEGKVPAIIIAPHGGSFSELMEKLAEDTHTQVVQRSTSLEAVSLVPKMKCCLILFHASENQDITKYINMLKLIRNEILSERVRIVMTTYVDDVAVLSKLSFHGCTEIIREPVPAKSLMFKLQRHLKILKQMIQGPVDTGEQDKKRKEKRAAVLQKTAPVEKPVFRMADPLGFESDFWRSGIAPKKMGGKWIVQLSGPSFPIGDWVWRDKEGDWAWKPVDLDHHPYISEKGIWAFQGQKPEFKRGMWWFLSSKPQLGFFEEGKLLGAKISVDDKNALVLTGNSPAAEMASYLTPQPATPEEEVALEKELVEGSEEKAKPTSAPEVNWDPVYRMVDPLAISNDIWLFKGRMPKWVGGRWLAKLTGPEENAGDWVEIKGDGRNKRWKWSPKDAKGQEDVGVWECTGTRPRYERDGWLFASVKPELAFYCEGKSYGAKIYSEEGNSIVLAKDSEFATKSLKATKEILAKEKAAQETLKKELSDLRIDAEHFGSPPGKWEFVCRMLGPDKCFVYIPYEIINKMIDAPDILELPRYFQYVGTQEPPLSISDTKKEWVFEKREPEEVSRFSGLSKLTREFLKSHYGSHIGSKLPEKPEPIAEVKTSEDSKPPSEKDELNLDTAHIRLNPLMLGLFVSEMMYRPGAQKKKMAQNYCRYISHALGGVRTELWVFNEGNWTCANTMDGEPEQFLSSLVDVEFFPKTTEQNTLVSPVIARKGEEDEIIGALVFGGSETAGLSIDIAQAFSAMAKGLVRAFRS